MIDNPDPQFNRLRAFWTLALLMLIIGSVTACIQTQSDSTNATSLPVPTQIPSTSDDALRLPSSTATMTAVSPIIPTQPATPTAVSLPTIVQWQPFELELTGSSAGAPAAEASSVVVTATFQGPGGASYSVPGFWDGGAIWRVRFAPPQPGEWIYTIVANDAGLDATTNDGALLVEPATADHVAANPNFRGFLQVSDNGRYFTYADGTPFFWLGGTIWRGNRQAMAFEPDPDDAGPDVAEFPFYIQDRRTKGFTAIQLVAGYPGDPTSVNEGGATYLEDGRTLNPAYFQWLDRRIQFIVDSGMVPVIVGQWHSAVNALTLPALQAYWDYLLARYQAYNVVWVTVGEYGFVTDLDKVQQLSAYIRQKEAVGQLITTHPTPNEPHFAYSSSTHFAGAPWLDFHMHQTWDQAATPAAITADYDMTPPRPIVSAEAGYDGLWDWTRQKVRQDAWTAYLSGAAGYTYGAHGVWNWNDGCCDDDSLAPPRWYAALDLPSSSDMAHLARFFADMPWWQLAPHQELVSSGYALARPGEAYLVYIPAPAEAAPGAKILSLLRRGERAEENAITLNLSDAVGVFDAFWFNPATGTSTAVTSITGGSETTLTPPFAGDAILYLTRQ